MALTCLLVFVILCVCTVCDFFFLVGSRGNIRVCIGLCVCVGGMSLSASVIRAFSTDTDTVATFDNHS